MKTIIHISADFPDPIVPGKTRAVRNLIDATAGFRHIVYSLNRTHRPGVRLTRFDGEHTAIAYGAPPYGIALSHFLRPVAAMILDDLRARNLRPDLIHAHKFSVEGLVASDIATSISSPFVCSLWGDTDIRIFEVKRGLRQRYRAIAAASAALLPAAPWTGQYFARALDLGDAKFNLLPVMTAGDAILSPVPAATPRIVSLFHMDSWKRKGLPQLIAATMKARQRIPELTLDIFGTGKAQSLQMAQSLVERHEAGSTVRLMGALPHDTVQQVLNPYTAFVMAPHRETYGMVHVEALLAGAPVLWSKDRGVDGLFNDAGVGYRADPTSVEDIANGIVDLVRREGEFKAGIAKGQRNGAFDHLRRKAITIKYAEILNGKAESLAVQFRRAG